MAEVRNPIRKWSYDSVESVTGRTPMKMLLSPSVDWAYRVNNFWLDGFGFYFKKPAVNRYLKWIIIFYLVLDWNVFSGIPLALWISSLILSQSISYGLLFYKVYEEARGWLRGTWATIKSIGSKMYWFYGHMLFVYDETIRLLASSRLGRFIQTKGKGGNIARDNDWRIIYSRSVHAIKVGALWTFIVLFVVGFHPYKLLLWVLTLGMPIAALIAPFLLNTASNRKEQFANVGHMFLAFFWGLADNVMSGIYRLTRVIPFIGAYARNAEDQAQRMIVDISTLIGQSGDASIQEIKFFQQYPTHYRRLYNRVALPIVFKALDVLGEKLSVSPSEEKKAESSSEKKEASPKTKGTLEILYEERVVDYKKEIAIWEGKNEYYTAKKIYKLQQLRSELAQVEQALKELQNRNEKEAFLYAKHPETAEYQEQLKGQLDYVKSYLEKVKKVRGELPEHIRNLVKRAEEDIRSSEPKRLERADWYLTELSYYPHKVNKKPGMGKATLDFLFNNVAGLEDVLMAVTMYVSPLFFGAGYLLNKLFGGKKGTEEEKTPTDKDFAYPEIDLAAALKRDNEPKSSPVTGLSSSSPVRGEVSSPVSSHRMNVVEAGVSVGGRLGVPGRNTVGTGKDEATFFFPAVDDNINRQEVLYIAMASLMRRLAMLFNFLLDFLVRFLRKLFNALSNAYEKTIRPATHLTQGSTLNLIDEALVQKAEKKIPVGASTLMSATPL
ncbi:MAG TPA: hypothetical protein PLB05_11650, partial [Candidatus Omnitrophota bacterium]|nr:hypothetical protein [Candidatus Omnitrophota bacterium]